MQRPHIRATTTEGANGRRLGGVLAELPRRQFIEVSNEDASLSQMRFVSFKVNHWRAIASFLRWCQLLLNFYFNIILDTLSERDSPAQRALRLRNAFEREGGSFIKLGIHLSLRLDFMPWVYCNELSCMTDRMKPFPVAQAIEIVERSTCRSLSELFRRFDPDPIISTSVACIYQAFLHDGEKVIVKVRRPGVGEQFMSDFAAFDWLLSIAELLTIFRPGFTASMRMEFRDLLLEELDFIQEARRQDAFRRAAADSRKKFFSAPRIHLDLTSEEVVINEFASGIWLWELLSAVEHGDEEILKRAVSMNIRPEQIAKRLLWVNFWSWGEHLFFHADPNPDNVIVGQDGKLFFINFTSTGTLNRSKRQAMRHNLYYAHQRDPQNMARASLVLLEPLPPIDLIELIQELETYNWQLIYVLEALPNVESWQERTSAVQWTGLVQLARKYGITIDIQVLRLIRSTLLLESMAARLDWEIDFVAQFWKFQTYRAEQARRRVTNAILDQIDGKGIERTIIRLDRIAHTIEGLAFRTSHALSLPSVNFNILMGKWSFAVYTLFRFIGQAAVLTLIVMFLAIIQTYVETRQSLNIVQVFQSLVANPLYQILILLLFYVNGKAILYRWDDKEVRDDRR
ncbi:MAG TPA: AarF/ABC1/UbiB kinase family protein [Anaerolineales bacterium]|nr:AarF/ABC1/UbiB kinase family protein [Anaerolineales bacterium]